MTTDAYGSQRRGRWRKASIVRLVLAATFTVMLLAFDYSVYSVDQWAHVVAATAGLAAALTLMGFAVLGWERLVAVARSKGLVETENDPN